MNQLQTKWSFYDRKIIADITTQNKIIKSCN